MHTQRNKRGRAIIPGLAAIAVGIFCVSWLAHMNMGTGSGSAWQTPATHPQLVSMQELPGDMCLPATSAIATMTAEAEDSNLFSSFDTSAYAADTVDVTRPPIRTIKDTYPIYSSVAVDPIRDEVALQDTNLFGIKIFNRTDNTPPDGEPTKPQRVIEGPHTQNEYNNGLYIDPKNGDIYSVAMDTADNMIVFSHDSVGDVAPIRRLATPHRNFASGASEAKGEMYITIQYPPKVMVYDKMASGNATPKRILEGEHTQLYDTHGIVIDEKRNLMFVGSWGNASNYKVAGSGKFYPPSINVYPLDASGDTAPLRVISGPKTQLDWAGGMTLNPDTGEIYVANDVGGSVLVFKGTDKGDVAPTRIIKGSKTGLNHPAGISIDSKNKEVWISNMGNSTATCYTLNANGDVAPIRTIRSAPLGRQSVKFGKPQAVAYDSKREMYLVPN
jgi:hypothetical protein